MVTASVLELGDVKAEAEAGTFDVVIGADVAASMCNPVALAHAICCLSHDDALVFVSFKERLSIVHQQFKDEMQQLFDCVNIVSPVVAQKKDNGFQTATWRSCTQNPEEQMQPLDLLVHLCHLLT